MRKDGSWWTLRWMGTLVNTRKYIRFPAEMEDTKRQRYLGTLGMDSKPMVAVLKFIEVPKENQMDARG